MPTGGIRFPAGVSDLLEALAALKIANPKATRSSVHAYPASLYAPNDPKARDHSITSHKMTEHLYFRKDNGFPTLARGLFTENVENFQDEVPPPARTGDVVRERIVARGYDKFFNTDEMAWTSWDAITTHTIPPYHLTLKSNGCLIVIAALDSKHLVVGSKHSLGTTLEDSADSISAKLAETKLESKSKTEAKEEKEEAKADAKDETESKVHAAVGRQWVARTLKRSGKTSEELARRLWEENLTAVLELCDDSFEEHVIATPEHWTGLHLHGLNYNTPHFATKTPEEVTAFAKEFGFIQTKHVTLNSVQEVKTFTDELAKSGSWEGEMIEGFVVRSTVADVDGHDASKPPYRPGAPFFFKIKFEEPYLLYRQFRETTRLLLPLVEKQLKPQEEADLWKKVRARTRRQEVGVYSEWCGRMMKSEPALFANYDRGVVRVRERFLAWIEADGKAEWESAKAGQWRASSALQVEQDKAAKDAARAGLPKKYVLVPVAVPGCGKTTVGVALNTLFGFGHTQSDDVLAKRPAPTFRRNIAELLKKVDVVYADRNNHIDKHYTELAGLQDEKALAKLLAPFDVRFIGVVWDIDDQPYHRVLRLCAERVVGRGDNHQTLRPDPTVDAEHEAVVSSFLHHFTTPEASMFDTTISVSIEDDQRTALHKVVAGVVAAIPGLTAPTEEQIDAALAAANGYKTTTPFHAPARVGKPARYFGLAPELDLDAALTDALAGTMPDADKASATAFAEAIRQEQRVTAKPHITLAHEKNVAAEAESGVAPGPGTHAHAWDECKALALADITPLYAFSVTRLVWDDRAMALVVSCIRPSAPDSPRMVLPAEVENNLHITVGTRAEVSPFESRGVVRVAREAVLAGKSSGEAGEAVEGGGAVRWVDVAMEGVGRVRGMY